MWCQFLALNRYVSADENSHNCCHQVHFQGCRYAISALDGPGKCFRVPGKVLEFFTTKRVGTLHMCVACHEVINCSYM